MLRARNTHLSGSVGARLAVGFGVFRAFTPPSTIRESVTLALTKVFVGLYLGEQVLGEVQVPVTSLKMQRWHPTTLQCLHYELKETLCKKAELSASKTLLPCHVLHFKVDRQPICRRSAHSIHRYVKQYLCCVVLRRWVHLDMNTLAAVVAAE
jgi:hypothetical protein